MEAAIHNAFIIECHEWERTARAGRFPLELRHELAEGLIGDSGTQPKAHNAPTNEELQLHNVGAHIPEMPTTRRNCAV